MSSVHNADNSVTSAHEKQTPEVCEVEAEVTSEVEKKMEKGLGWQGPGTTGLNEEERERVERGRAVLRLGGGESKELKDLATLLQESDAWQEAVSMLEVQTETAEGVLLLCRLAVTEQLSHLRSQGLLRSLLYPLTVRLQQAASRGLVSTLTLVGKRQAHALCDAVLWTMLEGEGKSQNAGGRKTVDGQVIGQGRMLDGAQYELMMGAIKDCLSPALQTAFLQRIMRSTAAEVAPTWTDHMINLVQTLITLLRELSQPRDLMPDILTALESVAINLASNLKFSKLIFALVSTHSHQVKEYKSRLENLANHTNTFMRKAILAKLSKI
mmetsp:Transcript_34535/g.47866  ORF Transcript_34535/g.47866 Transcript_34535/m.47866 type:complete len:326 (-) Transcript_34535:90-1067(-)